MKINEITRGKKGKSSGERRVRGQRGHTSVVMERVCKWLMGKGLEALRCAKECVSDWR